MLETDQKPLEAILCKSLNQATPRIHQILIRMFAYHFLVRYISGVTNQLADCLSWLGGQKDSIKLPKLHIHQITNHLHARGDILQGLRIATQEDDELALLKHTIMSGWPSTIWEVPSKIQAYWTFREQLTVEDGLVLKGTHIVIPHKKCQSALNLIHKGHLGLNKCKLRPKDTVYWPGFNEQLEKLVLNWELCLKYSHSKCKQKLSSSLGQEIPVLPWTKLATEIFYSESSSFVVNSGLYKQISSCPQSISDDRSTHFKPIKASLFWVWMSWDLDFWSWSMLCSAYLHQCYAVLQCQSYYQLSTLSSQMVLLRSMTRLWKACSTKLKKKAKLLQVFDDLMQYPLTGSLQTLMQILQGRNAISDLPMSNVARK